MVRLLRAALGLTRQTFRLGPEVEWWRAHRELQHDRDEDDDTALVDALAATYAHVYSAPADSVREAARMRALAMLHSDRWVAEGCNPESQLVDQERGGLVRSYTSLLDAVRTR